MIKYIKQGNLIYQNIEPFYIDENGNKVWNIPNDPAQLKSCLEDTLGWLVLNKINQIIQGADKKDASTSKAICLLAKIINTLNPDLPQLTQKEQDAFNKMLNLADAGYTDSTLLNDMLQSLIDALNWYSTKMHELEGLTTLDELIQFAEGL